MPPGLFARPIGLAPLGSLAGYDGDLTALRRQLELLQSASDEREEQVVERERWAEEQVEIERRLFADNLATLQAEQLTRHRELTQRMVQARSRAAVLAERNEAIRELMGSCVRRAPNPSHTHERDHTSGGMACWLLLRRRCRCFDPSSSERPGATSAATPLCCSTAAAVAPLSLLACCCSATSADACLLLACLPLLWR